jgi:hypothetical protein
MFTQLTVLVARHCTFNIHLMLLQKRNFQRILNSILAVSIHCSVGKTHIVSMRGRKNESIETPTEDTEITYLGGVYP